MTQLPTNMIIALFPLAQPTQGKSAVMPGMDQTSAPFAEAFATLLGAGQASLPAVTASEDQPILAGMTSDASMADASLPLLPNETDTDLSVADDAIADAMAGMTFPVTKPEPVVVPDEQLNPVPVVAADDTQAMTADTSPLTLTDPKAADDASAQPATAVLADSAIPVIEDEAETLPKTTAPGNSTSAEEQDNVATIPDKNPAIDAELSDQSGIERPTDDAAKIDVVRDKHSRTQTIASTDDVALADNGKTTDKVASDQPSSDRAASPAPQASLSGTDTESVTDTTPKISGTPAQTPVSQEVAGSITQHVSRQEQDKTSTRKPSEDSSVVETTVATNRTSKKSVIESASVSKQTVQINITDESQAKTDSAPQTIPDTKDVTPEEQVQTTEAEARATVEMHGHHKPKTSKHSSKTPSDVKTNVHMNSENATATLTHKNAESVSIEATVTKGADASSTVRHVGVVSHHQAAAMADAAPPPPASDARPFTIETPKPIQVPGQVRVRIDPPELGYIRVDLTSSANGIVGTMRVRSDQTRDIVERHIGALHKSLADAGVRVERLEIVGVSRGDAKQAFNPNTPNQHHEHGQASQRQGHSSFNASGRHGRHRQDNAYRQPATAQQSAKTSAGIGAWGGINLFA